MFETVSCALFCARVNGKRATGIAAKCASLPRSAPAPPPRASGALHGRSDPALYSSRDPHCPVGTPAKCAWTPHAQRLSSVAMARRVGIEMAGIGNATCRRRDEVPTPNLLDAARDHPVSTAFLAARLGCPSRGPVASSVSRSGERTPGARRAASWGARGRIEGAGAHRARSGSVGRPARAEVSVRSRKKTGNPAGCADIRVAEAGFPGAVLLAIAVDIGSNEVNARHTHARESRPPSPESSRRLNATR